MARLMRNLQHILRDAALSPMFGSDGEEFRRRLSILRDLDFDVNSAVEARRLAMNSFMQFIQDNDRRIAASYMDDLIIQYCDLST